MWTDQEKESMLARAKRDYPIGTRARSVLNNNEYRIDADNFRFTAPDQINVDIVIYKNGKWAEIVTSIPSKLENYSVF